MKINYLLLILLTVTLLFSCRRSTEYVAYGRVINKVTGEPIEGAEVILKDGIGTSGPITSSDGPSTKDVDVTNSTGVYNVKIKTKGGHGVLGVGKEGYRFRVVSASGGSSIGWKFISSGEEEIDLEMEGIAYFNSPFYKTSGPQWDNDSLIITLLSYDDLEDDLRSLGPSIRKGKGLFYYLYDDAPVITKGDRYLRYKLEFTSNGEWQTKIDSVYLPTSLEVYRDTIYY